MKKVIVLVLSSAFVLNSAFAFNPLLYLGIKAAEHGSREYNRSQNGNNLQSNQQNIAQSKTVGNGGQVTNCTSHFPLGKPLVMRADRDKVERRSFYLCRDAYAVQFDPAYKTPIWSAENLTADRMSGAKEPRENNFQPDPEVPGSAQAELNDYKGSHFDRGHMSPAADMKIFNLVLIPSQLKEANIQAMSQSFYLTNMVPQVGPNQNRGIWADLEGQVRNWALQKGQLLVVSGPIYDAGFQTMGRSKVAIPTRLYKVMIDAKTGDTLGFIFPNRQIVTRKTHQLDAGNPNYPQTTPEQAINCQNTCTIKNFMVPVSEVEKITGIHFFTSLSPQNHDKMVSSINPNVWEIKNKKEPRE